MNRLFPKNLLHSSWLDFQSYEYDNDVCGVIYRGEPKPSCGMPLGGIDTGCLDIETNGMLGYATIFNDLINPRLLYNCPFLGININDEDTYLLISDNKIKYDSPKDKNNDNYFPPLDYTIKYKEVEIPGLKKCDYIDYFGHYPVLDMEYHINDDIEIGLRSFSPFVPGKLDLSIVPGIYFQVFVRNKSSNSKKLPISTVKEALKDLNNFRLAEGKNIKNDIDKKIRKVESILVKVKKKSKKNNSVEVKKLIKKINNIVKNINNLDKDRLYQEVALSIEKKDINEEIVRLNSHIQIFKNCLKNKENSGKKMNFILQEMVREINTIGSKADKIDINHSVVSLKNYIEQIKEQVQNIL